MKKTCKKCCEEKDIKRFGYDKKRDYYNPVCKDCLNKISREGYSPEKKKNKAQYRKENRPSINKRVKEHRIDNKEKINDYERNYYEDNREACNSKSAKWAIKEYHSNPMFKLRMNMSRCMRSSLKAKGGSKNGRHWEDLVGYTKQELYNHLDGLLNDGMTWDNMGKWHVDHILPIASFDYTSPDDPAFKECWALSNLQPLWAKDNFAKSDKLDWKKS